MNFCFWIQGKLIALEIPFHSAQLQTETVGETICFSHYSAVFTRITFRFYSLYNMFRILVYVIVDSKCLYSCTRFIAGIFVILTTED